MYLFTYHLPTYVLLILATYVLPTYLSIYLPSTYLCPTCLLLSIYNLPNLLIYLPTYLVSTYILIYSLHK